MSSLSTRINLLLDMPTAIQIEKEAEKKGISRTQYIKEGIKEKLEKKDNSNFEDELNYLKTEIKELKLLTITILEKVRETS